MNLIFRFYVSLTRFLSPYQYSIMGSLTAEIAKENSMPAEYEKDPCIVCNDQQADNLPSDFDGFHQNCPRCGEFKISGTALTRLSQGIGKEKRAKLSGWVLEQNRAGALPMLTTTNLENILSRPLPSVAERATNLLLEAERGLTHLGERFNISEPRFLASTYSYDYKETLFLVRLLSEQGLVGQSMGGICEILPGGYIRLDELKRKISNSSQGFVAMWFDDSLDEIYTDGFEKGIFQAGYDSIRIDRTEHINRIDDEIISQIKASKFLVADFTGHRGGVYFESGFALGLDIPVFWTCRKEDMGELHFDIRQFNCIDWRDSEDLASRLAVRLEAVLGPGPNKP